MGTVRAVAKMGYAVVEFYSPYYDWTPGYAKEVRKLLDDLGIRCLSTHNSANALSPEGLGKAIELNQILGCQIHRHGQCWPGQGARRMEDGGGHA